MSFEPKPYGVTIEVSKEGLLKKYPEGSSPALKELLDSASISYKADWFKDDWFAEKKEHSKLNFSIAGLQEYCATAAKQYGATATFEEKANQMAYRLTVSYGSNSYYQNFTQKFLLETPNKELFYILHKAIEKGVKPLSTPPSNTPLGTTGTNKTGGDLTFSSPGWATASLSAYADLVTTSTTPWTGGTTSVAPSNKPPKPEKPFSIDDMYAGPKPPWAKKDKAQVKSHKHLKDPIKLNPELDKVFAELSKLEKEVEKEISLDKMKQAQSEYLKMLNEASKEKK